MIQVQSLGPQLLVHIHAGELSHACVGAMWIFSSLERQGVNRVLLPGMIGAWYVLCEAAQESFGDDQVHLQHSFMLKAEPGI